MTEPRSSSIFTGLTLAAAHRALTQQLRAAGIEAAERDARLIVELATQVSPAQRLAQDARNLTAHEAEALETLANRRAHHEPVSRLRGSREFYGRSFDISPAVLDPRPETETLIDAVLEFVMTRADPDAPLRILDIGTGSGCLIITLLAELPAATGLATDVSQAALDIARHNATRLGTGSRITFERCKSLAGITQSVDVLVSNPPYIPADALAGLEPDVALYDPLLALDGGVDGLDVYRDLARGTARIVPRGSIVLEVGVGQADAVVDIFRAGLGLALKDVQLIKDLGGHVRCVAMQTQV